MTTSIIKVSQTIQLPSPSIPNVNSSQAGLAPTAPNDPLQELNATGVWSYQAPWKRYNSIRNPEMIVTQRPVAAVTTIKYGVDGWLISPNTSTLTWSQINAAIPADTSGNNWYPYIPYAQRITITTAGLLNGRVAVYQPVEGLMAAPLQGGVTSISFLVRSSITGTFSVALSTYTGSIYSIVYPVTIAAANTWQRVTIPNIPVFTPSGTFSDGTAGCYNLIITLGTTQNSSTTGSWQAGNFAGATGGTNFAATNGTTFDITAVQHEPNPVCTPYIRRELVAENALNFRYLWVLPTSIWVGWLGGNVNWTAEFNRFQFPYPMRTNPTLIPGCSFVVANGSAGTPGMGVSSTTMANIENVASNWSASAYNGNWAQLANGGFTAEL